MRQTTTAEVRHNEGSAMSSIAASRATHRFGCPRRPSRPELFAMVAHKTRRWRSPVPESEECRADELFPSVNYLTLPDRFLNDAGERGRMGLSIWEMSVYQEAILVAEGT